MCTRSFFTRCNLNHLLCPIFLSVLWVWQTLGLSSRSCLQVYENSNLSSVPAVPFIELWLHEFPQLLLSDNWWTFLVSNYEGSDPFFPFSTTLKMLLFFSCPWENKKAQSFQPRKGKATEVLSIFLACPPRKEAQGGAPLGPQLLSVQFQLHILTLVCHSPKLHMAEIQYVEN